MATNKTKYCIFFADKGFFRRIYDSNIISITNSFVFILQAAYHTAKPGLLGQQLQQIELEEEKVRDRQTNMQTLLYIHIFLCVTKFVNVVKICNTFQFFVSLFCELSPAYPVKCT